MGEESSDQAMTNGGDSESGEGEVNYAGNSGLRVEGMVSEPYVGMEFDSEDAAKIFYNEYARSLGFSTKAGLHGQFQADGTNMYREFVCSREGLKRKLTESCEAMIKIEWKGQNKWVVTRFVKEHSHPMGILGMVNNCQPLKHFSSVGRTMPETYKGVGLVPSGVMYISIDGNPGAATTKTRHPIKNPPSMTYTVRHPFQKRTLGRDAQNLLEYFKKVQAENPGFFYAIQLDEDNRMSNVFWADARSRAAYSHFGDTVTLDTTHRVNQYRVPFTQFTGVNHHGQMILFGCALLFDDSEASVVWLLKTFLAAMNDRHPVSITTDQDRAIHTAVSQVFPQARHCINKWHVLREGQEKVGHVCHMHPNFHTELYNCINLTETIEEFDLSWNSIIDKYELRGNDWLRSLYSTRAQWVPAYFRDSFFAEISPNQGFNGSFFDGFVNQHTTLPLFFRQYEVAMEEWFEKEIESDFETICTTPVLKTPSPMESQAANLYTQKIFLKFQEELVETFAYTANRIEEDEGNSIFRVAKFEDDQKSYVVTLNHSELRANCSCQMFEFSGILCRHVLTVFTVSNVFTIPSHYILKRWTREAKISVRSDECAGEPDGHEFLTSRYANLCRHAVRYAEEGAVAVETYDAAVNALREGGKKIAVMKRTIAKVALPKLRVSRNANTDKKTPTSTSDTTPLLWPLNDETTVFNLNDASPPVQPVADLNLPQMASVPRQRVDGPTTVPCQQLDGPTTVPHQQLDGPTPVHRQRVDGPTPVPFQRVDGPTPVPFQRLDGSIPVPFQRVDGPTPVPFQRVDGPTPVPFQRVDGPTPVPFQRVDGPTSLPRQRVDAPPSVPLQRVDSPPPVPRQQVDSPPPVPHRRVDSPPPVPRRRIGSPSRVTRRRVISSPPVTRQRGDGPPSASLQQDDGPPENTVVLPCLKSMTWLMENKNSTPENRVAVINLKLHDNNRGPSKDYEVKFHLSRVTVEPVLKSMAEVSEKISTTASKVAVIHINHEDAQATSGETEVKFQVSRDALGAVLRSMAYIREQFFCAGDAQSEPISKRHKN